MRSKSISLTTALAALSLLAAQAARLADDAHEGKVLAIGTDNITVMDDRNSEVHTFVVSAETKVSRNGKPAKLSDILVGDMARVTAAAAQPGGKLMAKEIIAAALK